MSLAPSDPSMQGTSEQSGLDLYNHTYRDESVDLRSILLKRRFTITYCLLRTYPHFGEKRIMEIYQVHTVHFREKSILEIYQWCNIHFRCIIHVLIRYHDILTFALKV